MTLHPLHTVSAHTAPLVAPAFSPDGARVAAGDGDGRLVVWEREGADPEAPFRPAAEIRVPPAGPYSRPQVRAVCWPPAQEAFLAVHEYRGVCLRDAADLSERALAPHVGSGPIASGGGGAWLAALRETSVAILGLPGLEQRRSHYPSDPGGHEYFRTSALAADRDGALVAVGDDGGSDETAMGMTLRSGPPKVTLIDVEKNATVAEITDERAHRLMFDPWRGRLLVVTYGDVAVYRPDGPPVRRFRPYAEGLGSYVRALAITERWLITTAASHTPSAPAALDVWDPETLAPVASVPVPGGRAPEWIVPSPDGRTLLTPEQSADSSRWGIRVWSLRD